MHTLIHLTNQLNEYLRISFFKDYGPNGLQIEGKPQIRKVATAVSASLNVIDQAIHHNVDALIVHHGIFWHKDSFIIQKTKREKIFKLLKNGISLLAYHLPLDAHVEIGNNWKAARDLGWEKLAPFHQIEGQMIGVKGFVGPQRREDFRLSLEQYYGHPCFEAPGGKDVIHTASLISGGAWRQVEEASSFGIDCFITGNFDEPVWHLAHEEKINFMALGHASTEKIGPKALSEYLQGVFNLESIFIDEINPF